jgi:hypothetical protein
MQLCNDFLPCWPVQIISNRRGSNKTWRARLVNGSSSAVGTKCLGSPSAMGYYLDYQVFTEYIGSPSALSFNSLFII